MASFIFVVIGLLGASLPYPDPSLEMLKQQFNSVQFLERSLLVNLLVVMVGGLRLRGYFRKE